MKEDLSTSDVGHDAESPRIRRLATRPEFLGPGNKPPSRQSVRPRRKAAFFDRAAESLRPPGFDPATASQVSDPFQHVPRISSSAFCLRQSATPETSLVTDLDTDLDTDPVTGHTWQEVLSQWERTSDAKIPFVAGALVLPGGLEGDLVAHEAQLFDGAAFGFVGVAAGVKVSSGVVV